ncbi:DUF305 domain-containing protein [Gulosibacter molinativorax]|uniref:DUF305 domain-containing protein n=1 Tax=Gulosibacter molinativorax TaxID=256821 RepID=A0ABT7C7J7_9MICO|nr:DUF305 domain-containing protein [Gulosibacter molinativorax]MDJ1371149.1 DUF305 domain-containing protein [Gulosibacter molinativorax]QUY62965.1 DUF305 domain-containing protein [Gulosibacter molinativorax]
MKIRTSAIAAIALTAALSLTGCATGNDSAAPSTTETTTETTAQTADSQALPDGVNQSDVMFAQMMIPHHEQAIEMSDIILAKEGVDPEVISLAEAVKAAQGPEIEQLQGWLDAWGVGSGGQDMGHMGHGDGIMTEDDLGKLEKADGAEASKLWLEQMIMHHEGAVEMAELEAAGGSDPAAVELANSIVETQTVEIDQMRELLEAM